MLKFDKQSRRHFLLGAGGAVVSLPFMESLDSKAYASTENQKCVFLLWSAHGGAGVNFMLPPALQAALGPYPTLTPVPFLPASNVTGNITPAHDIRYGTLTQHLYTDPVTQGQQFSHIIGPKLSAYLNKMIVARGVDIPTCKHGHITGTWGNFRASSNSFMDFHQFMSPAATIDQVLSLSTNFYSTAQLNGVVRTRITNLVDSKSYDALGNLENTNWNSLTSIYNGLFGTQQTVHTGKKFAIDNVLSDFSRLMNPNSSLGARLSAADRAILDQFGTQLYEVQRQLTPLAACTATKPATPTYVHGPQFNGEAVIYENWDKMYDVMAQAIALAFTCGSTRIVNSGLNLNLLGNSNYHENVAHALSNPVQAQLHADAMRYVAEEFIASFAAKLAAIPTTDGKTMLDKSAIIWGQEHSIQGTHHTFDLPFVVVGGMDGALAQNRFVDYRNLASSAIKPDAASTYRPGILLNQFLANILLGAGLSRSDFERSYLSTGGTVVTGYGDTYIQRGAGSRRDQYGQTAYPPLMLAQMSDPLPQFLAI